AERMTKSQNKSRFGILSTICNRPVKGRFFYFCRQAYLPKDETERKACIKSASLQKIWLQKCWRRLKT
ncbi:hypothetical protein, partial [Bacillus haynesii]